LIIKKVNYFINIVNIISYIIENNIIPADREGLKKVAIRLASR